MYREYLNIEYLLFCGMVMNNNQKDCVFYYDFTLFNILFYNHIIVDNHLLIN